MNGEWRFHTAGEVIFGRGVARPDDLQRHRAPRVLLLGEVDDTHAALAQDLEDAEPRHLQPRGCVALHGLGELLAGALDVDGRSIEMAEQGLDLRAKLGSGVVLLAAEKEGRVSLALGVTADLTDRYRAGDLIREVASVVGGKGGGRPDFAQAGGSNSSRLDAAFERLGALIAEG